MYTDLWAVCWCASRGRAKTTYKQQRHSSAINTQRWWRDVNKDDDDDDVVSDCNIADSAFNSCLRCHSFFICIIGLSIAYQSWTQVAWPQAFVYCKFINVELAGAEGVTQWCSSVKISNSCDIFTPCHIFPMSTHIHPHITVLLCNMYTVAHPLGLISEMWGSQIGLCRRRSSFHS